MSFLKNIFKSKRRFSREIEPDEIFLDSQNLPSFNTQQFEGRIDTPISQMTIYVLGFLFCLLGCILLIKAFGLQIVNGETYFKRSENNSLDHIPLFADRGIITDRNGILLAWNEEREGIDFPRRTYTTLPGFSHILGYVTEPAKDSSGRYWQTEYIPKDGVEKIYDNVLRGENGTKIIETNVGGEIQSENIINPPLRGNDFVLSIDARVQSALYGYIKDIVETYNYQGGAGVILDIHTGEILAITSLPEYDSNIMTKGEDTETIATYLTSSKHILLNRAISGLYSPGSTVKPYMAIAALNENLISPNKSILSTGALVLPNPYNPDQPSIFRDWKAQGWTDMREALAVSSDVYFYVIGGGFEDQKGLGIDRIFKYMKMFDFDTLTGIDLPGEVSGVIPSIEWKEKNFPGDPWRVGNTYHTSIGQYGFQVTPIALAKAVGMLASNGESVVPTVVKKDILQSQTQEQSILPFSKEDFDVIHEGMRMVVTDGTSKALNVPGVTVAAKSGSAELGVGNRYINSWITGYFPYENPRYSFAVLVERGPRNNTIGAAFVMGSMFRWLVQNTPEYVDSNQ